jgi:N utilization substance protein B
MINRNLLRIKIIQVLYSYYKNNKEENDFNLAQEELLYSIDKTYELYHYFFQLILMVTEMAEKRVGKKSCGIEESELCRKLAKNRFAAQLSENVSLKRYLMEKGDEAEDWFSDESNVVNEVFRMVLSSEVLAEYAQKSETTYLDDKELWRGIVRRVIPECELLGKELEDVSIYWNDDADIVLSFVGKTIRQFEESAGEGYPLLPKFKDAEDEKFALSLFKNAIYNANDYKELIVKHTQNWEADRIAFLDTLIMQTALAEICSFPSIPVNVSMNEYLDLAKYYSTPRSSNFINGVLDAIVKELQEQKKITEVAYINNYKK